MSLPRICTRCILPETFPGISFDKDGVCNYCHREEKALEKSPQKKAHYRDRLAEAARLTAVNALK